MLDKLAYCSRFYGPVCVYSYGVIHAYFHVSVWLGVFGTVLAIPLYIWVRRRYLNFLAQRRLQQALTKLQDLMQHQQKVAEADPRVLPFRPSPER